MRAALLTRPGRRLLFEDVDLDAPKHGEVLVRVAACGACRSDWHLMTGATKHPMPVVVGHEGAGVVEAVGAGVTRVAPGDAVVFNWAPACGRCFYCRRGKSNLCQTWVGPIWSGTLLDGTCRLRWNGAPVYVYSALGCLAEQAVVPESCSIPIAHDVPLRAAALVGCAVATGVGAVIRTARVEPGSSVAVFGCGGVGINVVQGAALAGAERIVAIDPVVRKLEMAERFGATHTVAAGEGAVRTVRELTGGRGADYTFEAIGIPEVQEQAIAAARPGGTAVLVGLASMGTTTSLPGDRITREEKTIRGSYYGTVDPDRDFPLLIELYRRGRLKLDELVTEEYPLDKANEAFDRMLAGELLRGVIVFR